MASNGDTDRTWIIDGEPVVGVGSFHKTLPHNKFGEVCPDSFKAFVNASRGNGSFQDVPVPPQGAAPLVNPRAGLAHDRLTRHPVSYSMPPSPTVGSLSTAAEMTEIYWMALLRDKPFCQFSEPVKDADVAKAVEELDKEFKKVVASDQEAGRLMPGIDLPGGIGKPAAVTKQNIFRMGLPDEDKGPLVSQFFLRNASFGTQTIDQQQYPYAEGENYLTDFQVWLNAQSRGLGADQKPYPQANESKSSYFEDSPRYISTMRDLARFVHKDALHQAYFNAALIMLSGGAKWTEGNPYGDGGDLQRREAGFGTLGGPHILSLVSEVATRALKVVWNQKWQVNLRLRPEAYGGLVHVQNIGIGGGESGKRNYNLPAIHNTEAAARVKQHCGSYLLPMAFTSGSPAHPAYGAGHATVAGACVTVLKAYFQTVGVPFKSLKLRENPRKEAQEAGSKVPCFGIPPMEGNKAKPPKNGKEVWHLAPYASGDLTLEGELNKLASNVAMGRTMGGVHWRSDNTRSLNLGEALAAQILADITVDLTEKSVFTFRTFSRNKDGQPKVIRIAEGRIYVDGVQIDAHPSAL